MSRFVDFEEIKRSYSMLDVAQMLRIQLRQEPKSHRGQCPQHPHDDKRKFVISPQPTEKYPNGAFFCGASGKGGADCIGLVAHVLDCSQNEAANRIAEHFGISNSKSTSSPTATSTAEAVATEEGVKTLEPLTYLEADHPAVIGVGFDVELAQELGIGYAPKGTMRGNVLIPVRDKKGRLRGYVGGTDFVLPADFTPNVVNFPKSA